MDWKKNKKKIGAAKSGLSREIGRKWKLPTIVQKLKEEKRDKEEQCKIGMFL